MGHFRRSMAIAAAVVVCLLPAAAVAQDMEHATTVRPAPIGTTPRMPDGHPDLSGVWNGLGDNLLGVRQIRMYNAGIEVRSASTRDVASGAEIATWPLQGPRTQTNEAAERAATLLRRIGSNKPMYKPQYWATVRDFDANANDDDPSNQCMPAGVPRMGSPSFIGQTPTYLMFIYPGPRRINCDPNKLPDDTHRWPQAHADRSIGRDVERRGYRALGRGHAGH